MCLSFSEPTISFSRKHWRSTQTAHPLSPPPSIFSGEDLRRANDVDVDGSQNAIGRCVHDLAVIRLRNSAQIREYKIIAFGDGGVLARAKELPKGQLTTAQVGEIRSGFAHANAACVPLAVQLESTSYLAVFDSRKLTTTGGWAHVLCRPENDSLPGSTVARQLACKVNNCKERCMVHRGVLFVA